MYATSLIGWFSVILALIVPISMIFVTFWVYKIKKNNDRIVEQQKEMIELLKKP